MNRVKEKYLYPFLDILLNGFNYGFHIYTSWYLVKSAYGVLNAYLALISLFMVIGIALQNYSAKVTSGVDLEVDTINFVNPITLMGLPVTLIIICSPILLSFLKGNYISIILVIAILISHTLLSFGRGIIQGQGLFFKLNISFYIEVIGKITILLLILPRFPNIDIPLLSILIGYMLSLIHLKISLKSILKYKIKWTKIRKFIQDPTVFVFIISQFLLYSYFSLDMILVNGIHPDISAIYAVIQKFGMIQFFVGSSLMAVFLPELADRRIDSDEFNNRWKKCLVILITVLILFQLFYIFVFPKILPYMFGIKYISAAKWIPFGGIIFAQLVIINFFITTFLARGKGGFYIVLLIGTILLTVGIIVANSIMQILLFEGVIFLIIAVALFMILIKELKNGKSEN